MTMVEQQKGSDSFRPAQVIFQEAAVALVEQQKSSAQMLFQEAAVTLFIEQIANLDSDVKDDLIQVFMDVGSCPTQEELQEVEQTIRELIFPQAYGNLIVGQAGNANESSNLRKWTEQIGGRIKALRKEKGMNQEQLAKASGLPQSHISRLENGQHSPSHKTISALAKALGVTTRDLDPGEVDTI